MTSHTAGSMPYANGREESEVTAMVGPPLTHKPVTEDRLGWGFSDGTPAAAGG
ncbi:MAG TPA: hypothetical protein VGF45_13360 [Polyangia bacterium]